MIVPDPSPNDSSLQDMDAATFFASKDESVAAISSDNEDAEESTDDDEFYKRFFTSPPVSDDDLEQMLPAINEKLVAAIKEAEHEGIRKKQKEAIRQKEARKKADLLHQQRKQPSKESLRQAKVTAKPRPYQTAYLELCKQRNTIVHLGTGRGKSKSYRAWCLTCA